MLVMGPPGSGKSTRALELAGRHGLTVFDRDDPVWSDDRHYLRGVRAACRRPDAHAVVVRSGTTATARRWIVSATHPTHTLVMDTPADVCVERVRLRGRPGLAFQHEHDATVVDEP